MTSIAPRNTPMSAPVNTTSFAETLPDSPAELEVVMRKERQHLKASIEELGSAMRDKVDVSAKVRENPLAVAGAGFAVGLLFGMLSSRSGAAGDGGASVSRGETSNRRNAPDTGGSPGTFGKLAAAVTGMVGMRVADLAEDTIRESLAKSRFAMPDRKQHTS